MFVIPVNARIELACNLQWIPAYAGMTLQVFIIFVRVIVQRFGHLSFPRKRESSHPTISQYKSFHRGLDFSISSVFQARFRFLIAFSLAIAA